jgi:hypothetical protein
MSVSYFQLRVKSSQLRVPCSLLSISRFSITSTEEPFLINQYLIQRWLIGKDLLIELQSSLQNHLKPL